MPIEIRELQITTVVQDVPVQTSNGATLNPAININEISAACVEQVLEILKQKNER
ncbi:MAG: DUF5908 family protein [Ferruginibacter sp.]